MKTLNIIKKSKVISILDKYNASITRLIAERVIPCGNFVETGNFSLFDKYCEKIDKSNAKLNRIVGFVRSIHYIFSRLDDVSRTIIINEYLDKKVDYWWDDKYSCSTYRRKKIIAIDKFLTFAEAINLDFEI